MGPIAASGAASAGEASQDDVRRAFGVWARSVFGAPRRLDQQITGIEDVDESIVRLTTEVVRRELIEQRAPGGPRGARTTPPADWNTIDPFSVTPDELRARTEHIQRCGACAGSARLPCGTCRGSGRERCGSCGGSGKVRKYYKKSSRLVKCGVCGASGTVACGGCGASGAVPCSTCMASGQQLVWLEYRQSGYTTVKLAPDSPVLVAHPWLREQQRLRAGDLVAFDQQVMVESSGPIVGGELATRDEEARGLLAPRLDPRTERVAFQQFVRFATRRRNVRYEMCGTTGVVALSGADLTGASTPEALRPIRRRMLLWALSVPVLSAVALWYQSALRGPTAYFEAVNDQSAVMAAVAAIAGIVAVGGLLRSLRPGFRWWPVGLTEKVAGGVLAAAVVAAPVVQFVGRPRVEEARAALRRGDLVGARLVVDALVATRPSPEVTSVADDLMLAEAERLSGEVRLARFDAVAADHGRRADEARARARRERLGALRATLAAQHPEETLSLLQQWSAPLAGDPDAAELRASALEAQGARCADDVCRLVTAKQAQAAHPTPQREAAVATAHARLLSTLAARDLPVDDVGARVRSLRATSSLAASVLDAAGDDAALADAARSAAAWAQTQRAGVTLLGAPVLAVEDILERPAGSRGLTGWSDLPAVEVRVAASGDRCAGLYVVGALPGGRALNGREEGLRRLLVQATGQPSASLHPARVQASRPHQVSRWSEGGTPVLARWNGEQLMELRIGSATP